MTANGSYEGRRVIVSGGGGAGMGAAVVRQLEPLGAEIHVIDLKDPPVDVASFHAVDLRDPDATAGVVEKIGGTIDSLFNCAGLPGSKFPDLDVMLVNLVGMRHLAELVTERMQSGAAIASISSTAGAGYLANIAKWMPLVTAPGFDAAKDWCEAHPEEIAGGYAPSKEAIIIWTLWASYALAQRGIRVNCISPGPFPAARALENDPGFHDRLKAKVPMRRTGDPRELCGPLLFLASDASSYVTGVDLAVDGGWTAW